MLLSAVHCGSGRRRRCRRRWRCRRRSFRHLVVQHLVGVFDAEVEAVDVVQVDGVRDVA